MMRRLDQPELLDLGAGTLAEAHASLRDLERINRYLGGVSALTAHLYPRLRRLQSTQAPIRLVDLGTGSAALPRLICARGGCECYAVDFSTRNLDFARQQPADGVYLLQADALHLPFAPGHVDYFLSSLFLHHFSPEQVITLLRDCYARARHGLIMTDLVRGVLPLVGFKLVQPIFARSAITRYDADVSVHRGYTPAELRDLARQAGLPHARVHLHPLFRMTLVVDKDRRA